MSARDQKKKARGPESGFFDTLKGQKVLIDLDGDALCCTLIWVDVYTIGIRVPETGRERMIYKKYIRGIERDDNAGTANC